MLCLVIRGCVNLMFVPLCSETDQTGLEIRKSLQRKALRIPSAESIVTKRVTLAEGWKLIGFFCQQAGYDRSRCDRGEKLATGCKLSGHCCSCSKID
jgi:hypothetical protein